MFLFPRVPSPQSDSLAAVCPRSLSEVSSLCKKALWLNVEQARQQAADSFPNIQQLWVVYFNCFFSSAPTSLIFHLNLICLEEATKSSFGVVNNFLFVDEILRNFFCLQLHESCEEIL